MLSPKLMCFADCHAMAFTCPHCREEVCGGLVSKWLMDELQASTLNRRRKATLTPEEKVERRKEAIRKYKEKNKETIQAKRPLESRLYYMRHRDVILAKQKEKRQQVKGIGEADKECS